MKTETLLHHSFGQQELHANEEGIVTVRGFLYQSPEGAWILSQEPQLKSCCVGSQSKVMSQLYVDGNFYDVPSGSVVALSGVLKQDPKYAESGELTQYYTLQEASMEKYAIDYTYFIGIGALIVGYVLWRRFNG